LPLEVMCPECHRLFTKELEDKQFIGHEVVEVPEEPASLKGSTRLSTWEPIFVKKDISRYRYRYKCKHCGHEWTEIKTEERSA
jgi:rubredoxin